MSLRLGAVYVGNVIDGDRIGFDGPLPDDRSYPNERLSGAFGEALAIAELMEETGYDVLWLAEHHFQREGFECVPNIPMLSLWLAERTRRLTFGCGFNVLPTWNPIRLAEDFATVDILTGGRLIFGVGRGYHERELVGVNQLFTELDDDARRAYFEEQVEIIDKAFHSDSFRHHGRFFDLPPVGAMHRHAPVEDLTLVPRPARLPVEIWQPTTSGNPRGIDFMAKHAIRGMVAGMPNTFTTKFATLFQEANARAGVELARGERLAVGLRCYIADTEREARERLRVIFDEYTRFAAPLGTFPYTQELLEDSARLGVPVPESPMVTTFEETLDSGAWFAGTAQQLAEQIDALLDDLPGLEQLLVNVHIPGTHEENREQLRRFALEVMPLTSAAEAVAR